MVNRHPGLNDEKDEILNPNDKKTGFSNSQPNASESIDRLESRTLGKPKSALSNGMQTAGP